MDSTRLFTCIQEGVLADALYEDGKLMELSLHPLEHASILGNIYIGKVRNIVKNIQAAFVEIENGMLCYLPLEDAKAPVYTKPKKEGQPLVQGDELLVQVSREAVKTKQPSVTTKISMNGKYLVLTIGNGKLGCSGKLSGAEKARLRQWGQEQKLPEDLGMIIRTNASGVAEEDLNTEFVRLMEQYIYLKGPATHRTACSCVLRARPAYLSSVLGSRSNFLKEILTDDKKIYEELSVFLQEEMPEDCNKLRFYEDRSYPLKAAWRLEKGMDEALSTKVWMKSGAYLIIEPTEALTVIRKINLEAAKETARQLRLRNLSGIIIVDFVDMEDPEDEQRLLETMREQLKYDPMKAAAVDITSLGLMEVTRKKQRKTLKEQAKECGIL